MADPVKVPEPKKEDESAHTPGEECSYYCSKCVVLAAQYREKKDVEAIHNLYIESTNAVRKELCSNVCYILVLLVATGILLALYVGMHLKHEDTLRDHEVAMAGMKQKIDEAVLKCDRKVYARLADHWESMGYQYREMSKKNEEAAWLPEPPGEANLET